MLEGLKIALDHIDEVIKVIRASDTTEDAAANLIKKFKLSDIQAKAILAMQLRTLAGLERQKIEDELAELMKLIASLEAILADVKKIMKIIKDELLDVKKQYDDDRRTKVIPGELGKMSDEDLIADEQVVVTLTAANYVKRSLIAEYKRQGRGGKGRRGMATREEDVIEHVVNASNPRLPAVLHQQGPGIPYQDLRGAGRRPERQRHRPGQLAAAAARRDRQQRHQYLQDRQRRQPHHVYHPRRGQENALDQYQNVRNSGLIAIRLDDGDELKWIRMTNGDNEVVISTSQGQAIRFHEKGARPMGRVSRGVRGIRLRPGDRVIGMDIVEEGADIFVISKYGYGKRTSINQFTPHARGGVGIRSAVVNDKTGDLIGVKRLDENDGQEVIIISKLGQTIRLGLKDIPALGRATQGVRIMRLNGDDEVVSLALVDKVEDDDEADEDAAQPGLIPEAEAKSGKPPKSRNRQPNPPPRNPKNSVLPATSRSDSPRVYEHCGREIKLSGGSYQP